MGLRATGRRKAVRTRSGPEWSLLRHVRLPTAAGSRSVAMQTVFRRRRVVPDRSVPGRAMLYAVGALCSAPEPARDTQARHARRDCARGRHHSLLFGRRGRTAFHDAGQTFLASRGLDGLLNMPLRRAARSCRFASPAIYCRRAAAKFEPLRNLPRDGSRALCSAHTCC